MSLKIAKLDFMKMDSFDKLQCMDEKFKNKLIYEVKVHNEKTKQQEISYNLTFIGIKQMVLEMSQAGQPLVIVGEPKVERISTDGNLINDVWQAEVKYKNGTTQHETWGVSESPVFPWENVPILDDNGQKILIDNPNKPGQKMYKKERKQQYDPFGKTAAASKAIRNAERQHLPEFAIQLFVEKAMDKAETVQKVDEIPATQQYFCACPKGPSTQTDGKCKVCGLYSKVWFDHNNPS